MSDFESFWAAYPLKKGKREAQKVWGKLSSWEREQSMQALPKQIREWTVHGTPKHYTPRASTWLNQARFEDEFITQIEQEKPLNKGDQFSADLNRAIERQRQQENVIDVEMEEK